MSEFQTSIQHELSRRWWVIVLCAVLVAGALGAEKTFFGDSITKSGLYYVEQSVIVTYPDGEATFVHPSNSGSSMPGGSKFFTSFSMYDAFLQEMGDRYDFDKLEAGWNTMSREQRLMWMQKHLLVGGEGNAEIFTLYLPSSVRKDDAYLNEHGRAILEDYIAFTKGRLESAGLHPVYTKTTDLEAPAEAVQVSKKRTLVKYGAVGAFLGALFGAFVLLVNAMRNSRHA